MNEFTRLGVLTAIQQIMTELSPRHNLTIDLSLVFHNVNISGRNSATDNFVILYLFETVRVTCIDKNKAHHTQTYPDWESAYAAFKNLLQEEVA